MTAARAATAGHPAAPTRFELPDELAATEPPEARGVRRDQVRLLVAEPDRVRHARFFELPQFLRPGDLVVVNTSATLPAAVDGRRRSGDRVTVHFATERPGGAWVVELRPPGAGVAGPVRDGTAGERITLPGAGWLELCAPYPDPAERGPRLWTAAVTTAAGVGRLLERHGRPITYGYLAGSWPLAAYQTVFAREPGSAEMPSAARPFIAELVTELVSRGVGIAPITLHAGVSSLEDGEPPLPEPFRVPDPTARLVNLTRRSGGRVVAVGTTSVRALESVADPDGAVRAGEGWTDLVLGPARLARVVDGLVTGWHAPGASHLLLLEAVAGAELVGRAYRAAVRSGYRWHEFGDSCLLLPGAARRAGREEPESPSASMSYIPPDANNLGTVAR